MICYHYVYFENTVFKFILSEYSFSEFHHGVLYLHVSFNSPRDFCPHFLKNFFLKMSKEHVVFKCLAVYLCDIWGALMGAERANVVGTDFPCSLSLLLVLPVPTILAFPGHQSVSTRNDFQILKHVKRQTGQNSELSRDYDLQNRLCSDIFTGRLKEFQQGHSIW